jgi:hypothetical protein
VGFMKIFRSHMGLGDHIICNAIVRHLAKDDIVIVPVKRYYETSIKFMYSDDPMIKVVPFIDDADTDRYCYFMDREGLEVIWNGNVGPAQKTWKKTNSNFDRKFYEQANLDFNLRWDNFKIPENNFDWKKLFHLRFPNTEPADYVFLHNTSSTEVRPINEKYLQHDFMFVPDIRFSNNIFDYVGLLENAKEVHCINSSFLCLAGSLNLKCELHYHFLPKDINSFPTLRSNWIIHED